MSHYYKLREIKRAIMIQIRHSIQSLEHFLGQSTLRMISNCVIVRNLMILILVQLKE